MWLPDRRKAADRQVRAPKDRRTEGRREGGRREEKSGRTLGGRKSVGGRSREPCLNKTSVRSNGGVTGHFGRTDYRADSSEKTFSL